MKRGFNDRKQILICALVKHETFVFGFTEQRRSHLVTNWFLIFQKQNQTSSVTASKLSSLIKMSLICPSFIIFYGSTFGLMWVTDDLLSPNVVLHSLAVIISFTTVYLCKGETRNKVLERRCIPLDQSVVNSWRFSIYSLNVHLLWYIGQRGEIIYNRCPTVQVDLGLVNWKMNRGKWNGVKIKGSVCACQQPDWAITPKLQIQACTPLPRQKN